MAWSLAREGVQTTVFERGRLGQEASWAAAGVLGPQAEVEGPGPFLDLCIRARLALDATLERLVREGGVDPEYDDAGVLYVALNEDEQAELEHRLRWQCAAGLTVGELTGAQVRARAPYLSADVTYGLYFATDRQCDNRKLNQAYVNAAARAGVAFREGAQADEVQIRGGRAIGVRLHDGSIHEADIIVDAAGCWASQIRGVESDRIEIRPVRGQIICFETRPGAIEHAIFSRRCYLVPRRDGRLLAGSTREEAGYDKSVTLAGLAAIANGARALIPDFAATPFREAWAGLRPATRDLLPVIGPSPTINGLYYAVGHFRNGILLSALTGELIADLITGRKPSVDLTPFSSARFNQTRGK